MRIFTLSILFIISLIATIIPVAASEVSRDSVTTKKVIPFKADSASKDSLKTTKIKPKDTESKKREYRWVVEGSATTSSSSTPFWLMNNRNGLSSLAQNNGYMRAGFFSPKIEEKRWSYGFGADIVIPYNYTSKFVIQELYADFKYRSLQLTVGSRVRYDGVVDRDLSSGDLTFSMNYRPIPQIHMSMPEYQWIPLTNQWASFKGFFSIGRYTDGGWQKDYAGETNRWSDKVLYHSKGFWVKLGNTERLPVTLEGGLEMAVQFGGEVQIFDPATNKAKVVKMPSKFVDLLKSIVPMGGGSASRPELMGEVTNVYGNHVGQWSAAATFTSKETGLQLRTYYEHFFDDHSQLFLEHGWHDMLLGVSLTLPRNRIVDKILYEYIYTKDQSGSVYSDSNEYFPEQVSGRDDYYNHYMYTGWQHWGMGMGNALVVSPIFNRHGNLEFMHNRIKGHHIGVMGSPSAELNYKLMLSYSDSWGTYPNPTPKIKHNFNALVELGFSPRRLSGWNFNISLAGDGGNLLGGNVGAMISIRKTGVL